MVCIIKKICEKIPHLMCVMIFNCLCGLTRQFIHRLLFLKSIHFNQKYKLSRWRKKGWNTFIISSKPVNKVLIAFRIRLCVGVVQKIVFCPHFLNSFWADVEFPILRRHERTNHVVWKVYRIQHCLLLLHLCVYAILYVIKIRWLCITLHR